MGNGVVKSFILVAAMSMIGSAAVAEDQSMTKGMELVAKKSWAEAITSFDDAVKADSKNSEAYLERALCNFHLGKLDKVVDDCKVVTGLDAAHAVSKRQAYMMMAGALNQQEKFDESIQCCNKAIEMSPKNALVYADRAYAEMRTGKLDEALKDCNDAIQFDPKHANTYDLRAAIYKGLSLRDSAKCKEMLEARNPNEKPWEKKK